MIPVVINLMDKLKQIDNLWHPRIIGELNGQHVKIAKVKGEFVMHHHKKEDELFYVVSGNLTIKLNDGELNLSPGEFVIIPKGIDHQPIAEEEVELLLFEPASTLNTGNQKNTFTKKKYWKTMTTYEYEAVNIDYSIWSGRAKSDHLEIINEYGSRGWRFVCFVPARCVPRGSKGIELVFEKTITT